jgi:hypothetical protein
MRTTLLTLAVVGTIALGANAQPVFVKTNTPTATSTNAQVFVYKHELRKRQKPAATPARQQPSYTVQAAQGFTPDAALGSAPNTPVGISSTPNAPVGTTIPSRPTHYGAGLSSAPNAPAGSYAPSHQWRSEGTIIPWNRLFGNKPEQRRYTSLLPGVSVDVTPWPRWEVPPESQWTHIQILPGYVYEPVEIKGGRGKAILVRPGKGGGQNLSGTFTWGKGK